LRLSLSLSAVVFSRKCNHGHSSPQTTAIVPSCSMSCDGREGKAHLCNLSESFVSDNSEARASRMQSLMHAAVLVPPLSLVPEQSPRTGMENAWCWILRSCRAVTSRNAGERVKSTVTSRFNTLIDDPHRVPSFRIVALLRDTWERKLNERVVITGCEQPQTAGIQGGECCGSPGIDCCWRRHQPHASAQLLHTSPPSGPFSSSDLRAARGRFTASNQKNPRASARQRVHEPEHEVTGNARP